MTHSRQDSVDFVVITFRDRGTMLCTDFLDSINGVMPFVHVGYWAEVAYELERLQVYSQTLLRIADLSAASEFLFAESPLLRINTSPIESLDASAFMVRVRYGSPLELVLGLPGEVLGGFGLLIATAKGVLHLMNEWQRFKVNRAESDLQVAAYEFLRASIPTEDQALPGSLPTTETILQASRILPQIESISVQSNSQSIQDE